jgi:hypothetical protein
MTVYTVLMQCTFVDTIGNASESIFSYEIDYREFAEELIVVFIYAIPTRRAVSVLLNPVCKI